MKFSYYKSKGGNLGDDINSLIWRKLLKTEKDITVLGIGTIVYPGSPHLENSEAKIIIGSGVRKVGDLTNFKLSSNVDVQFVRGPLSSKVLNGVPYITDPGILVRDLIQTRGERKGICYIPYFASEEIFNYKGIGLDIVSFKVNNSDEMERVLARLSNYELIVTESLHGAIFADAFNIPWLKVNGYPEYYESREVHKFKWDDYNLSMGRSAYRNIELKVQWYLRFKKVQSILAFFGFKMNKIIHKDMFLGYAGNTINESVVDKKINDIKKVLIDL